MRARNNRSHHRSAPAERSRILTHTEKAEANPESPALLDHEFKGIRNLVLRETGIFLGAAQRPLVSSRLAIRLRQLGLQSYTQYYDLVTQGDAGGQELMQMINCITTRRSDELGRFTRNSSGSRRHG